MGKKKKGKNRLVVFGGIAVAAYLLFNWLSKRTYDKITYSAGSLRVHKVTASGIEFRMFLRIRNESDIPAPINGFIGSLLYINPNGSASQLGELVQVAPVQLPGFGFAEVEFSMKSGWFGTALELMKILTNGNPMDIQSVNMKNVNPANFFIKGTLKIGKIPVDIATRLTA